MVELSLVWSSFRIMSDDPNHQPKKIIKKKSLNVFFSQFDELISTNVGWNGPWVAAYQN